MLVWVCASRFSSSAFFEVFETGRKTIHAFEIRRFAGKAYRFQVYSSDALDTFADLPKTSNLKLTLERGGEMKTIIPGSMMDSLPLPHRRNEQGFVFGKLTYDVQEDEFEGETYRFRGG